MNTDTAVSVAGRTAPPIAVSGFTLAGHPLQEWVVVLTAIYLVLQIGWFIYSKLKAIINGSNGD